MHVHVLDLFSFAMAAVFVDYYKVMYFKEDMHSESNKIKDLQIWV